jgi:hypothetical protein
VKLSKFSAEEIELLFKIPFGLFTRRFQFHEVRKCVKKILWKIELFILKEHQTLKCDIRTPDKFYNFSDSVLAMKTKKVIYS